MKKSKITIRHGHYPQFRIQKREIIGGNWDKHGTYTTKLLKQVHTVFILVDHMAERKGMEYITCLELHLYDGLIYQRTYFDTYSDRSLMVLCNRFIKDCINK